jgi:hypothetical protein
MGPGTPRATRTTKTTTLLRAAQPAHHPPPRPPPRIQPAITIRTRQLARQQSAFDSDHIGSYNLQQCLQAPGRTLPTTLQRTAGGSLRVQDPRTLAPPHDQGQTERPTSPRPHPRCRYNTNPSSASMALNTSSANRP